jgi:hypothetical protein
MSVSLSTNSPLSYKEWLSYQSIKDTETSESSYNSYLRDWYNKQTTLYQTPSLKENYLQLVKDLSFLFGKKEKDLFLSQIDYNNDDDLIIAIPYFAKKLKEIAKILSYKRESVKRAKLKYNLIGSNEGLEKLLYEYILKGYTNKDDETSPIPSHVIETYFPDLSAVKDSFYVEIEELHDPSTYHDSDPTIDVKNYIDSSVLDNILPFDSGDLSEDEILGILGTRFLPRVVDTPLSRIFKQYLTDIPTLSTVSLSSTGYQRIHNEMSASQKYLAETFYGLTAVRLNEINIPDKVLTLDMEPGNNWFLWPSGDRIFNETLFNNIFSPIKINESSFLACSATAGQDYTNSDLIFTDKNGTIEGAWLKGTYTENTSAIVSLNLQYGKTKEFLFPYVGFKINSKNLTWNGYNLNDDDYNFFESLDGSVQQQLLQTYYSASFSNSASLPMYLNQTSLVENGALAAQFSDEADIITRRNNSTITLSSYADNILGATEQAYLYKFTKTDLPISVGATSIYWPLQTFDGTTNIPLTLKSDRCLPVNLSYTNPSKTVPGAVAGFDFGSSDVIYKLDAKTSEPSEAAWLGAGSVSNLESLNGKYKIYDNVAEKCAVAVEGPVQGSLSTKIGPLERISFVWMDEDTPADEVFKYYEHSADCKYAKTAPHDYYNNQDFLNPNPIKNLNDWTKCSCRSTRYSPIGNEGKTLKEYNAVADYLFADPDGLGADFALNSWSDTRGLNPYQSPQFSFYRLDSNGNLDRGIGWGPGKWQTGDGSPMILKTGRRYTYYRSSLRKDRSTSYYGNNVESPYLIVNYPYKNIKGICSGITDTDLIIIVDISRSQRNDIEDVKEAIKKIAEQILSPGRQANIQIGLIVFAKDSSTISYLTPEKTVIQLYLSQINIAQEYPGYRTDISSALSLADYLLYNRLPITDETQTTIIKNLCGNLNGTIVTNSKQVKVYNNPQPLADKKILIFSDGQENENIGGAIPEAQYLIKKGVQINAVDIGLLSYNNSIMEQLVDSSSNYFNLQKYLDSGDGDIQTFVQYITRKIAGCDNFVPTWYKAVRGSDGAWVGTSQISDMVLYPGDYLMYIHRDGVGYTASTGNASFTQPSISFTMNIKLDGWDYTNVLYSPLHIGSSFGAKPFWGKVYNTEDYDSTTLDNRFTKTINYFGGQVRFFDDYVPIHQPEVSTLTLKQGDFCQYIRKGYKDIKWNQPTTFEVSLTANQWNKLVFYKDTSNLVELLRNNTIDSIGYGINEPSSILLESFSQFRPAKYNYYARNKLTYKQDLYYNSRCPTSFVVFNTGAVIQPVQPYANLDNRFYPTIATVSYPELAVTERQVGEYLLPEKLGTPSYRGRGYTIDIDGANLSLFDSLSVDRIFPDPNKYGPRTRGLTKNDQLAPVTITDIDSRWMMEDYNSGTRAGVIVGTIENQKFTPYQTSYEIKGKNYFGLFRQGEFDNFQFWTPPDPGIWNAPTKYPLTYRNEVLSSSYINRVEGLLVNKGGLEVWRNDIFGNNYGLYKNPKDGCRMCDNETWSGGSCNGGQDKWVSLTGNCLGGLSRRFNANGMGGREKIYGCTNPLASNYNPLATIDNGSCDLIYGCLDCLASNYNPNATFDDGSCLRIRGCTDPIASNYNPEATIENGTCSYVSGCTNPKASNYNPEAVIDNGGCTILGCTYPSAINWDPWANTDDGSCIILGCTNPLSYRYNPNATVDDGKCDLVVGCVDPNALNYDPKAVLYGPCVSTVYGCTNQGATNYNPLATVDNGSCVIPGCTNKTSFNYNPRATQDDGSCVPVIYGCTNSTASNYNDQANTNDGSCIIPGCTNPGTQAAPVTNYNPEATVDNGSCTIEGCTNQGATNYNDQATQDDGSCVIPGCMNDLADNYNENANEDDGSCVIPGCTSEWADNYDPLATVNDIENPCYKRGCMNSAALNYDEHVTEDDGSCQIMGCMIQGAWNYDSQATINYGCICLTSAGFINC